MKRIIATIMTILTLLTLFACASETKTKPNTSDNSITKWEITPTDNSVDTDGTLMDSSKLVGSYIYFGTYEQDGDTSNGEEAIEWLVLSEEGNKKLLISRYVLDCQRYNETETDITWETCSLRKWLNETFINSAFNVEEQSKIISSEVVAEDNPSYSTPSGNNTIDKIFLLSVLEAKEFFISDEDRQCFATTYSSNRGVDKSNNGNCDWWLRTPGYYSNSASFVYLNGALKNDGAYVQVSFIGVRPALWVSFE